MTGQLIVSVSGIGQRSLAEADSFCAQMNGRGIPVSLLAAPQLKGGYRLDRDPATVEWLAVRCLLGDAIVLHGYDEAATKNRRAEFAALPAHEANLRLMGADRVLEHLGLRTRLFAAPGWEVSRGTIAALPRNGFRLVAGQNGITDLVRDTTVAARVFGVGDGARTEAWWSRMLVRSAERTARRGGTVRIAASARKLPKPGVMQATLDAVDLALLHGCVPTAYHWRPLETVAAVA